MKKVFLVLVALMGTAVHAFAGVGIEWSVAFGGYTHDAPNVWDYPSQYFLLNHVPVTWQLIYAGANCLADPPSQTTGGYGYGDDYVSGDDQVWAQRTIPLGGGTAPEDGTHWDFDMYPQGGDTSYVDFSWATAGFVYMRVYEGTPGVGCWYYETPLMAMHISYGGGGAKQQFYVDSYSGGFQPNQQLFPVGGVWLDISFSNQMVANSVTGITVGVAANGLDSGISWQNDRTGQSGYIDSFSVPGSFNCTLLVGTNTITASGYSHEDWDPMNPTSGPPVGTYVSDTLVVIRQAAPRLDITNANAVVAARTSNVTVRGVASNLFGSITWTNSLGGAGAMAVATPWSFTCPLQFGTNVITARGTNLLGDVASDVLEVVRSTVPQLDITNANAVVASGTSNMAVGGSSSSLAGTISWTNSLGGRGTISATTSWSFLCPLQFGTNVIAVRGTNLFGDAAADTLEVVRRAAPHLQISNANVVVAIGTSNLAVGGTSSNLSGAILWTNSLGGTGSMAAEKAWSFLCPLQFGTNVITASGATPFGEAASDTLEVVRSETLGPRLDFTIGSASNILFAIPAGYTPGAVQGADMAVTANSFVWSNLTEGLHYSRSVSNISVQPAAARQLIRMGLTFP